MHADIPKFRTFFVIFEQFFIHSAPKRKNPFLLYKEGTVFHHSDQHRNCATNGSVSTEKMVETKVY